MWFYTDHAGTNSDSRIYVVVQIFILVKMEAPVSMWFYKESYWYKWRLQCLCGFTKNHNGKNVDSSVYVLLQRNM